MPGGPLPPAPNPDEGPQLTRPPVRLVHGAPYAPGPGTSSAGSRPAALASAAAGDMGRAAASLARGKVCQVSGCCMRGVVPVLALVGV